MEHPILAQLILESGILRIPRKNQKSLRADVPKSGVGRSAGLAQRKTQQELADEAGVNRSTLIQIEKGNPVGLLTFIQLLRSLKKLELLRYFEYKEELSPLKMAALQEKKAKRIRH